MKMLDRTEIERLAAAAAALRPEWPIKSLCTFLARDHAHRSYADVAIALTAIAVDPKTKTPKRMNELGPWWAAAAAAFGDRANDTRYERCPVDGHRSYPAGNCGACRSEDLATERPETPREHVDLGNGPDLVRAAMRIHGVPTTDELRTRRAAEQQNLTEPGPVNEPMEESR